MKGHLTKEHLVMEHLMKEHLVIEHLMKEPSMKGHLTKERLVTEHLVKKHSMKEYLLTKHLMMKHLMKERISEKGTYDDWSLDDGKHDEDAFDVGRALDVVTLNESIFADKTYDKGTEHSMMEHLTKA